MGKCLNSMSVGSYSYNFVKVTVIKIIGKTTIFPPSSLFCCSVIVSGIRVGGSGIGKIQDP